jgi:hypothetical protein
MMLQFLSQLPLSDVVGVGQPQYLAWNWYACGLHQKFLPHLLLAFHVFSHLPLERYCKDVKPFARDIFYNINNSFGDIPCCCDDAITPLQRYLHGRIPVRDCHACACDIPSCIYYSNVGQGLLVATCSVDCWHNVLLDLIVEWHYRVSPQHQVSLHHTKSRYLASAWTGWPVLTLGQWLDCLPPPAWSVCWLRFGFVLRFSLLFELLFELGCWLLLQQAVLW